MKRLLLVPFRDGALYLRLLTYVVFAWAFVANVYIFCWGFTSYSAGVAAAVAWQTADGYGLDNQALSLYAAGVVDEWFKR